MIQYRWGRYTRGCNVILFVVDTNAIHLFPDAKTELHRLLEDKELATTPVLVVANKIGMFVLMICLYYIALLGIFML